jgi:hypothetical protein
MGRALHQLLRESSLHLELRLVSSDSVSLPYLGEPDKLLQSGLQSIASATAAYRRWSVISACAGFFGSLASFPLTATVASRVAPAIAAYAPTTFFAYLTELPLSYSVLKYPGSITVT